MNMDLQEPPSSDPNKRNKDKGMAPKTGFNFMPAISGFAGFGRHFILFLRNTEPLVEKKVQFLKKFYSNFVRNNGITKSVAYQLGLLLLFAVIAGVSEAQAKAQNYSDEIRYTKAADPIETGQFVRYLSPYTPMEFYIDPDKVALAQMEKTDSYTLAQQLSVNSGDNIEQPQRQAPTYTLAGGETITQVAQKFDLHVGTLLDANNIQPADLKKVSPGTVLDIPSSDSNTTDDWLVAINKIEEEERQAAAAAAAKKAEEKKKAQVATAARTNTTIFAGYSTRAGGSSSISVEVIGYSNQQCLPWAREQTGANIQGYAGNVATTQSDPTVGAVAFDRFYGHASVVVGVGDDYIVVHEANWIPGRITERKVSKSAIRGYVY